MLFHMLDASHEGHIQADEFLNGCLRLDGPAKAIDLAAFMEESRKAAGLSGKNGGGNKTNEEIRGWYGQGGSGRAWGTFLKGSEVNSRQGEKWEKGIDTTLHLVRRDFTNLSR